MGDGAHTHARQAIRREESWVESTLAGRFYDQVRSTPDRIAIADAGSSVSYAALGARVAGLSELFRAEGVRPGGVAAVLADTGIDAVAALLGILQCGAAFAPLDVLDPPMRAGALLELAGSTCLVTSGDRRGQALEIAEAAPLRVRVVDLSPASPAELGRPAAVTPTSPASVFFTSGSTGLPKAVLDLQRNVLHNVLRYTNLLAITADDRLSAVQRLGFSGIASSIFTALLNGATLCTFRLDAATLPALAAWVRREQVTVFHAVPAIFRVLVASGFGFPDVRVVRLEGDRASWRDVELFRSRFAPTAILANGLGTTETGLVCQYRVGPETALEDGVLPVGLPAPGMDVLVLDEHGAPKPDGSIGEIAVRSRYLAAGYKGAPELTAERFLRDGGGDARIYRTGDVGRVGPGGRLEYLGRIDGSLRIGGVRVEPAEVEAALLSVPGVVDAVVHSGTRRGAEDRLAAAFVVVDTPALTGHEVHQRLEELLPPVMIPLRIDVVESLPRSNDWKVDRSPSAPVAPANPLERRLQQIWEDVLEVEGIGSGEAFADLGGDSLAAAEIVARIETETGRPLAPSVLTEATTIQTLAQRMRESAPSVTVPVQLGTQRAHDSTPLFLAHDLAGDVRLYADLADALPWTTWGLAQTTPLAQGASFTGHAAGIVGQIRTIQPHGPYRVGGHCFGAVLAFEVAHQLTATGESVELLALLGVTAWDFPRLAPAPWRLHIERSGLESAQHRIALHLRRARELGFYHGTRHIVGAARAAPAHFRMRSGSHPPRTESTVVQQRNTDAFRAYRPAMFPGTALVLVSASDAHGVDPATAWSRVARQTRVHVVGDANVDMLRTPHAGRTAEILVRSLAEAQTVP